MKKFLQGGGEGGQLIFIHLFFIKNYYFLQMNASFTIHFYRTRVRSLGMLVSDSLTDWLTDSCLVNLIDVALACEDGNSKLVEVVTVVEVDDEKRVDNSLVQIWKVNFGHKILWPVRFFVTLWFPTGSINWNLVSRSAFGDVKIDWHILLPGPNPITHLLHTSYHSILILCQQCWPIIPFAV